MAKITISLMRELEQKVTAGEISYSRMVEILNEQVLVDSSNASQQVSKATKDLTDEVERLKARIEELKKQNNELKNIDDCPHENVDMKSLRCTICLECGNIIDVID